MKRTLLSLLFAVIAVTLVVPEKPVLAQRYYKQRTYKKRRVRRSTWTQHRHPRRTNESRRLGLYVGGGLLADFVGEGDTDVANIIRTGGGFDLFLGIRFAPLFALELGGLMSVHATDHDLAAYDSAILNGLTLDGKIFFMPSSTKIEPFFQGGGGAYMVQEEGYAGTEMSGGGYHLGGGLDFHLSQALSLGVRGLYKGIWMDNGTDLDPATRSVYHNHFTLEGNIQLHF